MLCPFPHWLLCLSCCRYDGMEQKPSGLWLEQKHVCFLLMQMSGLNRCSTSYGAGRFPDSCLATFWPRNCDFSYLYLGWAANGFPNQTVWGHRGMVHLLSLRNSLQIGSLHFIVTCKFDTVTLSKLDHNGHSKPKGSLGNVVFYCRTPPVKNGCGLVEMSRLYSFYVSSGNTRPGWLIEELNFRLTEF